MYVLWIIKISKPIKAEDSIGITVVMLQGHPMLYGHLMQDIGI